MEVRERLADGDLATALELAAELEQQAGYLGSAGELGLEPQVEQQAGHLGATVEIGLDSSEHATVLPERAGSPVQRSA